MPVVLAAKERHVYDHLKADLVLELGEETIDAANAAALSGKLLQMASGAIYTADGKWALIHDRKLNALEDIYEAANSSPLLVAYWFQHDCERIQSRFPHARELKTSADIEAWNRGEAHSRPDPPSLSWPRTEPPGRRAPACVVLVDVEFGALPANQRADLSARPE